MAGDNDGHHGRKCSCEPSYQTYDYYVSEEVHSEQTVDVRRDSVYYTLGDAEVWDPYYVKMKNDVFSDTIISKDGTVTMYGDGTERAFPSNARFTKTGDGAFQLPAVKVKRQYVNYGTYNEWESDDVEDSLAKDLEHLQQDADSIIGKFMVKSDTVDFFDGFKIYRLSDGSMGLKTSVQIPSFPPESELTSPGDFDSYNNVPDGIMIKPTKNNGHHETASIAYYKQIQCIPTDKYKTDEMIKTKVIDDGDDDVMVYTPAVNDSQINLDYSSKETGADKIKLSPNDNYDQATEHGIQDTFTNIQLDREYTMTLSVVGDASDLDGYGYQDYVRYLALDEHGNPYTQVRFPFPVQMVSRTLQNGSVVTDDRYYYANTWIDI